MTKRDNNLKVGTVRSRFSKIGTGASYYHFDSTVLALLKQSSSSNTLQQAAIILTNGKDMVRTSSLLPIMTI